MSWIVAELLDRCRSAGLSLVVEGNALHVDFECDPPGELIEEIRRHKPEVMAALSIASPAEAAVIAPAQWFGGTAPADEPPYDKPSPARRGLIRRPGGRFEHFCTVCGAWGAFGYGVTGKTPGRWFCFRHRALAEAPRPDA